MKKLLLSCVIICLGLAIPGISSAQDVHQGVSMPEKKTVKKKTTTEKVVKPDDQERIEAEEAEAARIAEAEAKKLADVNEKFMTSGRFATDQIFFEPGTDKIIPDSSQVLNYIGKVLQDNPKVKIKIIAYPDTTGTDSLRLAIANKRAAAIKFCFKIDFRIDPARIQTEGKKKLEAIDPKAKKGTKLPDRLTVFEKL